MTTTRVPSEAELIELENWLERFNPRYKKPMLPKDHGYDQEWVDASNLGQRSANRWATMQALLDLARTVQNPGK